MFVVGMVSGCVHGIWLPTDNLYHILKTPFLGQRYHVLPWLKEVMILIDLASTCGRYLFPHTGLPRSVQTCLVLPQL